jgi:hypothetical protein
MGHESNGSWAKCLMGHVGHGSSYVTHRLLWSTLILVNFIRRRMETTFYGQFCGEPGESCRVPFNFARLLTQPEQPYPQLAQITLILTVDSGGLLSALHKPKDDHDELRKINDLLNIYTVRKNKQRLPRQSGTRAHRSTPGFCTSPYG